MATVYYLDYNPDDLSSSPGVGPLFPDYIIVGAAPSVSRTNLNHPFGSKSVKFIEKYAQGSTIYWTTLSKSCKEYGEKFKSKELAPLTEQLFQELQFIKGPHTRIIAQGTDVCKILCPGFSSLREDHGARFFNPELQCFVTPSFPFAAISRDPSKREMIVNDLNRFFTNDYSADAEYVVGEWPETLAGQKVFLDIETTGVELFEDHIMMIGFSTNDSPVYILDEISPENIKKLFDLLTEASWVIGHNFQFDLAFFHRYFPDHDWTGLRIQDTMLMAYVLGEEVLSLKHLTSMYTKRPGSHGVGGFEDHAYLAEDVASTREVYDYFYPKSKTQWITKVLCELVPRMVRMREAGVYINWDKASELEKAYQAQLQVEELALQNIAPLNWNSSQQVSKQLLKMKVPLYVTTDSGAHSVSEPVLQEFKEDHPIVNQLLSYRDLIKEAGFINSYRELQVDGFLHPKLSLTGTATGRLSCSDPNLQQVPRLGPIKLMFSSRYQGGYVSLIDLSQAELRVAALLSNDDLLAEALMSEDVHRFIASMVYELPKEEITSFQRKKSKGITFGLLYGGGAKGLAERVGVSQSEVEKVIKVFYGKFKKLSAYLEDQVQIATTLYQSTTPLGRIRNLKLIGEIEGDASVERKAKNTPIQGTASDIMLIIINSVFKAIEDQRLLSKPMFGVHDSSLYDVHPQEVREMTELVQNGFRALNDTPLKDFPLWGTLPIVGEFILAKTWAHAESTNENYAWAEGAIDDGYPKFRFDCSNLS